MKRALLILALVAAGFTAWIYFRKDAPPALPFARATEEKLVSELSTNGRVEPSSWSALHTPQAGRILTVNAKLGELVRSGQVVAVLEDRETEAAIAAAQARAEEARAEIARLERGGTGSALSEIEGEQSKLRVERSAATRDVASLERLASKQAATAQQVREAKDRVSLIDAQLSALDRKRSGLVASEEKSVARARLNDAEASIASASRRRESMQLRAPASGTLFELPARAGEWVETGALIAKVGGLEKMLAVLYVDEPDLGRVKRGQPVSLTWDAMTGKVWRGVVEEVPTSIVAMGTRQVGEVRTLVENPGRDLPAGANVNARILAEVVEQALTIPKECLRREKGAWGVYLLESNKLVWRPVEPGASSVTRTVIRSGLKPSDSVALPADVTLTPGMTVTPLYP